MIYIAHLLSQSFLLTDSPLTYGFLASKCAAGKLDPRCTSTNASNHKRTQRERKWPLQVVYLKVDLLTNDNYRDTDNCYNCKEFKKIINAPPA